MGLPAGQQHALDGMERTLQASEPHMAAMFAIFARLNAGEGPVGAEPLMRSRRRRRARAMQPGGAMYAIALIPVVFVMVIAGVLLGGSAHGMTTCGAGVAVFAGTPLASRPACKSAGEPAPARTMPAKTQAGTVNPSCAAAELAAGPAARIDREHALRLPPGTEAVASAPPGMCYKLPQGRRGCCRSSISGTRRRNC